MSPASASEEAQLYADRILVNANVYTVDATSPDAEVVAIQGSRILWVGPRHDERWGNLTGPNTEIVDLDGLTVVPGLIDSHTHPGAVALSSWHVALPRTDVVGEILDFLRRYAEQHPVSEVPFLYAEYYPSAMDWGPDGPSATAIDTAISDRPVLLQDSSDHACTVNSTMLRLLGVDDTTPHQIDPHDPGPRFVRGLDGKTPTGQVLEGAWGHFAERMYDSIGWRPPFETTPELLAPFLRFLSSKGVVALLDAASSEDTLESVHRLEQRGELNMHYSAAKVFTSLEGMQNAIAELRSWQRQFGGPNITADTLKLFLDGTNEVGTSAVLAPFVVGNDDHGVLRMSEADLIEAMVLLNGVGLNLHIHVVGDRGFRTALNAAERAADIVLDAWRLKVTLCHNELVDPDDMPRVEHLGVYLNWTPHWSGGYFGKESAGWLGQERFDRMYQFNPIIESGAIVTYGSDVVTQYEAHRANPFFGIQTAHTRIDPDMPLEPGAGTVDGTSVRQPLSARLSLPDLLDGYTLHGATQLRLQDQLGSIAVGRAATLCVLNRDLFSVPADEVQHVEPVAVMVEGRWIHGNPQATRP